MRIQINETISIESDPHCWILSERRTYKNSERDVHLGYFSDLTTLLEHYIDLACRMNEDITTINGLLEFQKSLITSLNEALQPLKIKVQSKGEIKN